MEFELTENFTNTTIENESSYLSNPILIVFEILLVFVCIIGVCADVLMVYMTFRFKKLRTVPNIIISNWAIADIFPLVFAPIDFVVYPFVDYKSFAYDIISFLFEIGFIFYNTILLFVAALTIDWCLASYFTKASEKYRKHYKFIVAINWILTLIAICIAFTLKMHNLFFVVPIISLFFLYMTLLVFILILQIARHTDKCKRRSSKYPTLTLTISTVCLLCWSERWVGMVIADFIERYFPFLSLLGYLTFAIVFVIIYRGNRDFQACFRQVWKRSNNRYVDEIPDVQNSAKNTNSDNQTTQVCFHQNGTDGH